MGDIKQDVVVDTTIDLTLQKIGEKSIRALIAKSGKKLDMGKCCVRFKQLDDLALDVIGEAIRRVSAKQFIAFYEANRPAPKTKVKPATPRARPKAASKSK